MNTTPHLNAWASLAGLELSPRPAPPPAAKEPSTPSLARAHVRVRERRARVAAQQSLLPDVQPAPDVAAEPEAPPLDEVRWTLTGWVDDGAGYLRYWLPDRLCCPCPELVAACVEPDDKSEGWTITVLRPTGRDRVAWWSGGSFAQQVRIDAATPPAEGERRVRRDGDVFRIDLMSSPHAATLEAAQQRVDRSLAKMLRRFGREG